MIVQPAKFPFGLFGGEKKKKDNVSNLVSIWWVQFCHCSVWESACGFILLFPWYHMGHTHAHTFPPPESDRNSCSDILANDIHILLSMFISGSSVSLFQACDGLEMISIIILTSMWSWFNPFVTWTAPDTTTKKLTLYWEFNTSYMFLAAFLCQI